MRVGIDKGIISADEARRFEGLAPGDVENAAVPLSPPTAYPGVAADPGAQLGARPLRWPVHAARRPDRRATSCSAEVRRSSVAASAAARSTASLPDDRRLFLVIVGLALLAAMLIGTIVRELARGLATRV